MATPHRMDTRGDLETVCAHLGVVLSDKPLSLWGSGMWLCLEPWPLRERTGKSSRNVEAHRAPRRSWHESPGGSANVEKDGKSQVWELPSPSPPDQAGSFLSPPLPSSSSCFYQQGRRGQPPGRAKGSPSTAARPSQASLASETAALPVAEGVFLSLQLEYPLKWWERSWTTPPKLASPSQKRHSLGTGWGETGCPLKAG